MPRGFNSFHGYQDIIFLSTDAGNERDNKLIESLEHVNI